jgi:AcrR family transcriptional regulator
LIEIYGARSTFVKQSIDELRKDEYARGMTGKTDGRRELGDHTRQRLLRATRRLLAERGIGGVRLRDVAEAAGVNIAAVSYHFGSLASLVCTAVREAADAALGEQASLLASLPPDAPLEDIVTAWVRPTVRGLQRDPEAAALLRIASQAITEAPADLREWAEGIMERSHRQLATRLRPALPGLDDQELAFRVFCAGGIANRFHTAAGLPSSAAASSPDLERLLVAAITGLLAGPGDGRRAG